jgi:hypothetical protein
LLLACALISLAAPPNNSFKPNAASRLGLIQALGRYQKVSAMRLRLRLLWLILASLWRKRMNVLDEFALSFIVLPNDIDVSKISDDRYLAITDLGRAGLALRAGIAATLIKRKWVPLATFATLRFRYPLKVFQRYQLLTKIVFWDDETFYLRHVFQRHRRTVATGYVCATFLGPHGPVRPEDILAAINQPVSRPERPEIVSRLKELGSLIHDEQREIFDGALAAGP